MTTPPPDETVRLLFEARAAGDRRRVIALMHPDIEATAVAGRQLYRGVADVLDYFERATARGGRAKLDAHEFVTVGDEVSVYGRIRIMDHGTLTDSPAAWRFTVQGGRVRRIVPLTGSIPVDHVA